MPSLLKSMNFVCLFWKKLVTFSLHSFKQYMKGLVTNMTCPDLYIKHLNPSNNHIKLSALHKQFNLFKNANLYTYWAKNLNYVN